jgi:hypothetical protein
MLQKIVEAFEKNLPELDFLLRLYYNETKSLFIKELIDARKTNSN